MPKRKRGGRGYRARKRRRFARRKPKMYRELGILGTKHKVNLVYSEPFTLNPGAAGTAAVQVYRLNGMYDPNVTGVGHQPRGFDQLMALYDHFVVINCKAEVRFWNADNTYGHMVCTHIQDDSTVATDPQDILERKTVQKKMCATRAGGIDNLTMVRSVNPNRFLGRTKPLSDPELKGSAAGDPTEQAYLHISCFPMQSGADSGGGYGYIRLTYTAILIEPQQPVAS